MATSPMYTTHMAAMPVVLSPAMPAAAGGQPNPMLHSESVTQTSKLFGILPWTQITLTVAPDKIMAVHKSVCLERYRASTVATMSTTEVKG